MYFHGSMYRILETLAVSFALGGRGVTAHGQATTPDCPIVRVDSSKWTLTRDSDIGIELKHPTDYEEKHWESRSDTLGADLGFIRSAGTTLEFHQMRGFWSTQGPNKSVAPCRLEMRSGVLTLYLERTYHVLSSGQHAPYFVGKGLFTPFGKPQTLAWAGALDSASLLEQLMILRTIRFLGRQ